MNRQPSRRGVLSGTAAAAAALTLPTAAPGRATAARRAGRPTVAVFGGGVGGLSAAHELVERGFDVTVYERKSFGGKARSMPVSGTGSGGRADLPGEHGFRFFPGICRNLPDTLSRIPVRGNPRGVLDNLTTLRTLTFSLSGGRRDLVLPVGGRHRPGPLSPELLGRIVAGVAEEALHLPPADALMLANRVLVFVTSSEERRLGQWEDVPWWTFLRADERSADYRNIFAVSFTRLLAAMKAEIASANTVGRIAEGFMYNLVGIGYPDPFDRILDAPTNEAWIDPWTSHLTSQGARLKLGWSVEKLNCSQGRITSAGVRGPEDTTQQVTADWYVLAVPVERAARLIDREILQADPRLAGIARQQTDWMTGIQFYLRRPAPITPGHMAYVDTPWAVSSISQSQFWPDRDFARDYGDGTVTDCLSTVVAEWTKPGVLYGKPARECTAGQLVRETWAQLNGALDTPLPDDIVHSWHIDPAVTGLGTPQPANDEPLLIHPTGSWRHRPDADTAIPNLFLAADYVRTDINIASMESANQAARAAVNALLEAAGSTAERCTLHELHRPPEFELAKRQDAARYRAGLPNLFDLPPSS
ncbi:FAD-dependent oxidoreductase [Streptomyces monticola]|uniref:FAD-dependent oxidoreductase n=1 Tax=Streptomyces monticola TaxID=2666263 RepID=A0ABW2JNE3_9ACTN